MVGGDGLALRPTRQPVLARAAPGRVHPRLLHPSEQDELPALGLGITNMAARASARADELSTEELLDGAAILTDKVARYRPRWVAVVGVTAYRIGFQRPKATFGPQPEPLAGARLWVLPNPSGLNAHFTPVTLGLAFAELRAATDLPDRRPAGPRVDSVRNRAVSGDAPTSRNPS